jgi:DNA-binding beta-propeller fold protein YncE
VIDDWEATAQTLAGAGLKWIFTGHYHANDIVEKAFDGDAAITDVETGSLVTFPCPVRFVTLHGGNAAVIETETVDAIDDDTGGVPFPQYAEAFLMEGLTGIAAYTLAQPVDQGGFGLTDPSQIAQIAGLIAQAFKAHYAGDETPDTGTLQTIQALTGSPDPTQQQLGGYLATLWTDPAPRDDRHYLPLAPTVELALLGTYRDPKAEFDDGASEIVAHDPATQRLFVINGSTNELDILDAVDPENLALIRSVPLEPYGAGGPTSVAASKGLVAVAVAAEPSQDPGTVVLMDVDGVILDAVPTGALPDMVTFTPDGSTLLVANEGEPSDDYTVDPEGSVTVVSLQRGRGTGLKARTASFRQFNRLKSWLKKQGVRIFGPGASVAQDLEPESIATSRDGRWAWVSCQENNAVALLHVPSAHFTAVYPLGFKDLGKPGNAMDASNQDGGIRIRAWPGVMGMYQPDAIAVFQDKGIPYIVTANEGDARDYDAFSEEERVKDLILDPTVFGDADLQEDENLGRLYVTTTLGDADGDGLYEALFAYGARSFSIFAQTPKGLQRIYDSGDQFERITAAALPQAFNSDNDDNDSFDSRSDDKGPEPEGLAVGVVEGRRYAFVCLERIGGIMVYDITRPWKPVFVQYLNNRNFEEDAEDLEAGDLGPEGLAFVAAQDSPTGFALLLAANEVSGSTSIYEIRPRGNHRDRFRHHWVKAR